MSEEMSITEAMRCCVLMLSRDEVEFGKGKRTTHALSLVLGELGTLQKHCYPSRAIVIGGEYCCPECKRPIKLTYRVCHNCGKKLSWDGVVK